ncbi:Flp pilus assembly protein TadD [Streptomyces tendae]|uniref:hypothetical protein n=1 Tax=Streptomyces tendae TaxID=1932 RepID=UPI003833603A
MRIRTATAALIAALAVALVGCGSDDGKTESAADSSQAQPSTTESTEAAQPGGKSSDIAVGIPAEPTGAERDAVLAAVMDVNAKLVADEDKAIDAARNQCSALDGGASNVDHLAAQRFSYGGVTLTDDDGDHLNIGLRKTLCPEG